MHITIPGQKLNNCMETRPYSQIHEPLGIEIILIIAYKLLNKQYKWSVNRHGKVRRSKDSQVTIKGVYDRVNEEVFDFPLGNNRCSAKPVTNTLLAADFPYGVK